MNGRNGKTDGQKHWANESDIEYFRNMLQKTLSNGNGKNK
jgi:hypothetical protein